MKSFILFLKYKIVIRILYSFSDSDWAILSEYLAEVGNEIKDYNAQKKESLP